jgi:hypothetical protein
MCFVTELCLGSLEVYLGSSKKLQAALDVGMPELTNGLIMHWMKGTATGIAFMHAKVRTTGLYSRPVHRSSISDLYPISAGCNTPGYETT